MIQKKKGQAEVEKPNNEIKKKQNIKEDRRKSKQYKILESQEE